jgi:succinate dehydrogenase / fumarate reductase cytochrome b subunit
MKAERPVNLDLTKFHFPLVAILSILHRISGVLLFLLLPLTLYLLYAAYTLDNFAHLLDVLKYPWMKFGVWVLLSATFFHLLSGVRHLIMDLGFFESAKAGRATATIFLILAIIVMVLLGVWIW